MITEELKQLYQTHTGSPATDITELSSSGSNRRYFRLSGSVSLIGVSGTSIEENNAFIYMAAHFREKRLPVPQVYCWSVDKSFYLQEDLGDTLLFQAIEKGRKSCRPGLPEDRTIYQPTSNKPGERAIPFPGNARPYK